MKTSVLIIGIGLFFTGACVSSKQADRFIDKGGFAWTGEAQSKLYTLVMDSSKGHWFDGRIIIDQADTIYLRGFEKGNNHPTHVRRAQDDSKRVSALGYIFIWTRGSNADTLYMDNTHDSIPELPLSMKFYKK